MRPLPKQYGSGNYYADQRVALMQLAEYLKIAEKGQLKALLDAIEDDDTRGTLRDYTKPHPNAVLLEALILFVDIASATGRPMSGFAEEMLKRFSSRRMLNVSHGGGPVWVPSKN